MCGRYLVENFEEISETLKDLSFLQTFNVEPTWNAAPSQELPVIISADGALTLRLMQWGLIPSWVKPGEKPKVTPINARSETIADKPMFRNLIKHHRCIVPANGFYEWKRTGGPKQPYFIHMRDEPVMLMAGLYSERRDEAGEPQASYTILTGGPNDVMAGIHDRMPVMLHPKDVAEWMDPEIEELGPLEHLLQPIADDDIDMFPVSTAVNSVKNNGPELIEPVAEQDSLL